MNYIKSIFILNLVTFLIKLVNLAHLEAQKVGNEGLFGEKNKGEIEATIKSLCQKWSYNWEIMLIDIASELILAFATRHKFNNGNKRTALIIGKLFLRTCGLFLLNSNKDTNLYLHYWENFMVTLVEKFSDKSKSKNEILLYIKNKLLKNIKLLYTWIK